MDKSQPLFSEFFFYFCQYFENRGLVNKSELPLSNPGKENQPANVGKKPKKINIGQGNNSKKLGKENQPPKTAKKPTKSSILGKKEEKRENLPLKPIRRSIVSEKLFKRLKFECLSFFVNKMSYYLYQVTGYFLSSYSAINVFIIF